MWGLVPAIMIVGSLAQVTLVTPPHNRDKMCSLYAHRERKSEAVS